MRASSSRMRQISLVASSCHPRQPNHHHHNVFGEADWNGKGNSQELERCILRWNDVCNMQINGECEFLCNTQKKGDRRQINTKIWKFRRAFANMAALDAFSKSLGSCFVIDEDILLMSIFTAIVQLNRHNTCNSLKPGENYVKCRRINYSAPTGKKGRKIYVCLS